DTGAPAAAAPAARTGGRSARASRSGPAPTPRLPPARLAPARAPAPPPRADPPWLPPLRLPRGGILPAQSAVVVVGGCGPDAPRVARAQLQGAYRLVRLHTNLFQPVPFPPDSQS